MLGCNRYTLSSSLPRQNDDIEHPAKPVKFWGKCQQEHTEASAAVYDLVAAVYYHSPTGSNQAVDGISLSGSVKCRSSKQQLRRRKRRTGSKSMPVDHGHYTAAVFRSNTNDTHCTIDTGGSAASTGQKRELEQSRSGSW